MSVPLAIIVFRPVESEPDLIPDTTLCLPSEIEPLVPRVHIFFDKVIHTPRIFISLVPIWDLSFGYF